MTTEDAIKQLEECGWPSVAADLRDGISKATVLSRLSKLAWEEGSDGQENEDYAEPQAIVATIEDEVIYEFTITISVTATSPQEAAGFALDDLRDAEMEWDTYTLRNTETGEVTQITRR